MTFPYLSVTLRLITELLNPAVFSEGIKGKIRSNAFENKSRRLLKCKNMNVIFKHIYINNIIYISRIILLFEKLLICKSSA